MLRSPGCPAVRREAFTFLENVVAVALVAIGFASLYALSSQCLYMLNAGRESVIAGQALQDRMEQLRNSQWSQLTDATAVAGSIMNTAAGGTAYLGQPSEVITINSFPTPLTPPVQITRSGGGVMINSTNPAIPGSTLVKVDLLLTWRTPPGNRLRSAGLSTVMAQNPD